ncbi:protein of unknown function [Devosia enhydra]|uniref:Uncharacterized protein n=1 Tax=Devosia enhydra TaxID=665118 RepID=A0A1K2HTQ7_9HYPH|nr:DUF4173 domain-containing protein [Devosia enhydra]SFZ81433.1 protein of unknown function [Devosia enhydra]
MHSTTLKVQKKPGIMLWVTTVTILLVILIDILVFAATFGINIFLTAIAIALAIISVAWRRRRFLYGTIGFLMALTFSLPLIESATLLGLLLSAVGLGLSALMAVRLMPARLEHIPLSLLRLFLPAPTRMVRDAVAMRSPMQHQAARKALPWLVAWIVPLGLGAVFTSLFAAANPLIEAVLSKVRPQAVLELFDPIRFLFWLIVAAGIWALLRPKLLRKRRRKVVVQDAAPKTSAWLGSAAIFRSLVVFNALFATQTIMDLAFLWGGVALPDGMSHAEYAHRGAYPLIVTALLAAAFVLAAMRERSPVRDDGVIRALVYLFIAQNILLCLSAMLRLELYVEVYSLTEWRLAAGIWMGLVAVGLVLMLLRIWLRRSNAWLVASNFAALTIVLYASALLDLSSHIAQFNVEHSRELTGQDLPIDIDYLSLLGPSAIPALDRLMPRLVPGSGLWAKAGEVRSELVRELRDHSGDWRGWSWRAQRLKDYLVRHAVASALPKRQNDRVVVR